MFANGIRQPILLPLILAVLIGQRGGRNGIPEDDFAGMMDGAVVRLSRFQQPHLFAADFGNDRIDKFEDGRSGAEGRSEEHTSELQSLMRISYAVFCLKKHSTIYHTDNTTSP